MTSGDWQPLNPTLSDTDPGDLFDATAADLVDLGDGDYLLAAVDRASGVPYCRVVVGGRALAEQTVPDLPTGRATADALYTAYLQGRADARAAAACV